MSASNTLRLAALAAGLALAGAACGGGGNGGGTADVASLGSAGDGEQAAASTQKTASEDPEQAMLDFAKCMREHGIDMPDPEVNTSDGAGKPAVAFRIGGDISPEKMEEADKECRPLMGKAGPLGNISPEEQQEMQDKAVEHARCMREHGVDMPDPQFDGPGGGRVQITGGALKAIDIDSEEFAAAQEACGGIFGNGGPVTVGRGEKAGGGNASGGKASGGIVVGSSASSGSSE